MGTLPVFSKYRPKANIIKRGGYGSKIIKTFISNGREYQLHATKGWRSYRIMKEAQHD